MSSADEVLKDAHVQALDMDMMFQPLGREQPEAMIVPHGARPLHGRGEQRRPEIQKENAWHRQAAYLIAQGLTQKQVAAATGKSLAAVNLVFAQQWFQNLVVEIIRDERIEDGAFKLLRNASAGAAMQIITLAAGGQGITPSVQLKANEIILTRVLGPVGKEKPEAAGYGEEDTGEIELLDRQIQELEEKRNIL